MRRLTFLLLIFQTFAGRAQHKDPDKLVVKYSFGNVWDTTDNVRGEGEWMCFVKQKNGYYKLDQYLHINYRFRNKNDTTRLSFLLVVQKRRIETLLNELSVTKDNFASAGIMPHLHHLTKNQILAIAKRDTSIFNDILTGDVDKDDRDDWIKRIQNLNNFEYFLKKIKPDTSLLTAVTDFWDGASVKFYNGKIERFDLQFWNLYGQPVQVFSDDKHWSRQIANLNIGLCLYNILPRGSMFRQKLDLNNLLAEYMKWYVTEGYNYKSKPIPHPQ